MENNWTLELRQLPILGGNYAHYYWVKRDVFGNWKGEIHGYPSKYNDKTQRWERTPNGIWGDTLKGYSYSDRSTNNVGTDFDPVVYVYQGEKDEIQARYSAAENMSNFLNEQNIDYEPFGLRNPGNNSNAFAYTMGIAMGFYVGVDTTGSPSEVRELTIETNDAPFKTPGWGNYLLSSFEPEEYSNNIFKYDEIAPECFTAETPILMSDGTYKPIAEIKIGEEVMAFEGLGELQPRKVTQTFITPNRKVVQLGNIKVTLAHHFLQPDGSFETLENIDVNDFLVGVTGKLIPHPGIQPVEGEHTVYNFTVEGLHTYVAGDYRVHNTSLRDHVVAGSTILDAGTLPDGTGFAVTISPQGKFVTYRSIDFDGDKNTDLVQSNFQDRDAGSTLNKFYDEQGNLIERDFDVKFANGTDIGQQIGTLFGSSLGQAIGGDDIFAQIASNSVLATVVGNVGDSLHVYFRDTIDNDPNAPTADFLESVEAGFDSFANDLFNNIKSSSTNAISSFLSAELSEALDIPNDFGGQLLNHSIGNVTSTTALSWVSSICSSTFKGSLVLGSESPSC